MTEIEVGVMKITNSCLICVLLMKMMTHQIVFGLIKVNVDKVEGGISGAAWVFCAREQNM